MSRNDVTAVYGHVSVILAVGRLHMQSNRRKTRMIDWELSTNQGGGANKGPKMSVCEVRSSRSWLQHIFWADMLWKSKLLFAVHFTGSTCRPRGGRHRVEREREMQHARAWIRSSLPCLGG
jgi:hypothetical protein